MVMPRQSGPCDAGALRPGPIVGGAQGAGGLLHYGWTDVKAVDGDEGARAAGVRASPNGRRGRSFAHGPASAPLEKSDDDTALSIPGRGGQFVGRSLARYLRLDPLPADCDSPLTWGGDHPDRPRNRQFGVGSGACKLTDLVKIALFREKLSRREPKHGTNCRFPEFRGWFRPPWPPDPWPRPNGRTTPPRAGRDRPGAGAFPNSGPGRR